MIHITDLAYNKIKKLVIDQNKVGIRIGVKTTGCSGLAYVGESHDYVDSKGRTFRCTRHYDSNVGKEFTIEVCA